MASRACRGNIFGVLLEEPLSTKSGRHMVREIWLLDVSSAKSFRCAWGGRNFSWHGVKLSNDCYFFSIEYLQPVRKENKERINRKRRTQCSLYVESENSNRP